MCHCECFPYHSHSPAHTQCGGWNAFQIQPLVASLHLEQSCGAVWLSSPPLVETQRTRVLVLCAVSPVLPLYQSVWRAPGQCPSAFTWMHFLLSSPFLCCFLLPEGRCALPSHPLSCWELEAACCSCRAGTKLCPGGQGGVLALFWFSVMFAFSRGCSVVMAAGNTTLVSGDSCCCLSPGLEAESGPLCWAGK